MRTTALLLAALLLAGCSDSGSPETDGEGDEGDDGIPHDGMDGGVGAGPGAPADEAALPVMYINGTLDATAGGCPPVLSSQAPGTFPGDVQAVDAAAWNRTYTGPSISTGVNSGDACLVWLDAAGEALDATGTVPDGAAEVAVFGTLQAGADYSIRIG